MEAGSGELELYGKSPLLHLQGGPGQYRMAARGEGGFFERAGGASAECNRKTDYIRQDGGACGRKVVAKPITFGAAEARGRKLIAKPITFSAAEACGRKVIAKPITFGAGEACGRNVVAKPITSGVCGGAGDGCRRLECRAEMCGGKQLPFIHLLMNGRLLLQQRLEKQHLILHISTKVTRSN